jgi:hypothetical protein
MAPALPFACVWSEQGPAERVLTGASFLTCFAKIVLLLRFLEEGY